MTDNCVSPAKARLSRTIGAACAALVVLCTAGISVRAKHAMSFVAMDLGTLDTPPDGSTSEAFGVNDKGIVVGTSSTARTPGALHAFRWSERAGMKDLGTLGPETEATAITDEGVIVGLVGDGINAPNQAFVRTRSTGLNELPTLGGLATRLSAMNGKGDIVGSSDFGDGTSHAFLWTRQDGILDLGTLGGPTSNANAINDRGIVVGDSTTVAGPAHAFMWTRHSGMVDLGTLRDGDSTSTAQAVNDEGVIAGFSQTNETGSNDQPVFHAFIWTHRTKMVDIGDGGDAAGTDVTSFGEKINGRFVIGHFTKNNTTHGFIWTRAGGFVDIGTLAGDTTSFVTGVNDQGVVVGNSIGGGSSRAFVWSASTGITQLSTPVGGSSRVNAITDNFIVGASCGADLICYATLWKPASHSHGGRHEGDDD